MTDDRGRNSQPAKAVRATGFHLSRDQLRALAWALLVILTGNLTAGELQIVVRAVWTPETLRSSDVILVLSSLLLFAMAAVQAYKLRSEFVGTRSLSERPSDPHPYLILIVSPSNRRLETSSFPLRVPLDRGEITLQGESLEKDLAALDQARGMGTWNWQQLLRAVRAHQYHLVRLQLVGSTGEDGSHRELESCASILRQYLPNTEVIPAQAAIDFTNFNELTEGIAAIVREEKRRGVAEDDIVIDVTGGFKTASIAGAMVTLSGRVKFQYVETGKYGRIYLYQVVYYTPVSL
jgi:hypothetical protein